MNIATGAQLGLPSGGAPEIENARAAWNAAGSSLTLTAGARLTTRCLDAGGFTGILVTFNDPCHEISDVSNLLALANYTHAHRAPGRGAGSRPSRPADPAALHELGFVGRQREPLREARMAIGSRRSPIRSCHTIRVYAR